MKNSMRKIKQTNFGNDLGFHLKDQNENSLSYVCSLQNEQNCMEYNSTQMYLMQIANIR